MKNAILLIPLTIALIVNSCVIIKEMVPQRPSASITPNDIQPVPDELIMDYNDIGREFFYVKGFQEKHTPNITEPSKELKDFLLDMHGDTDLNRSPVIRFYNKSQQKIKRIFICIPGIYSGGGTLANLAISLKARMQDSEVWIWERRANLLEDRRPIIRALNEKNQDILLSLLQDGELRVKPNSFYQPSTSDISFVGYWGLNVMLNDLKEVVMQARKRADEIVLMGYSLGVLYATVFLANDFDPSDNIEAGHQLIDKVLLMDGPPMIDGYVSSESQYKRGVTIIPYNKVEGISKLESGKYYPCNGAVDRDFSLFFENDVKECLAFLAPEAISPELYKIGFKRLPINNQARFLIEYDDNYLAYKLFTATFGRADAVHMGKFTDHSQVKIIGLKEGMDHIGWKGKDFFEGIEFNDSVDYLKASCNDYYDMPEWYQPTRVLLDLGSIHHNDTSKGWQKKYFHVTQSHNINLPFLCVGLTRGLSSNIKRYLKYKETISSENFDIIMINKITHLDGDTISDIGGRPILADVIFHWFEDNEFIDKDAENYQESVFM